MFVAIDSGDSPAQLAAQARKQAICNRIRAVAIRVRGSEFESPSGGWSLCHPSYVKIPRLHRKRWHPKGVTDGMFQQKIMRQSCAELTPELAAAFDAEMSKEPDYVAFLYRDPWFCYVFLDNKQKAA
jgi:hypothetical protein